MPKISLERSTKRVCRSPEAVSKEQAAAVEGPEAVPLPGVFFAFPDATPDEAALEKGRMLVEDLKDPNKATDALQALDDNGGPDTELLAAAERVGLWEAIVERFEEEATCTENGKFRGYSFIHW
jgi:hypothetical protein